MTQTHEQTPTEAEEREPQEAVEQAEALAETEGAQDAGSQEASVARSTAMMSALVIVSRITGFARTWAQAFAMGATVLASCYEVANNLPTQIYELVTAGMLVTAFLPVYVSVKRKLGRGGANRYVSNLVSIVTLITGAVTLVSFVFAAQIIWTQSFSAAEEFNTDLSIWFFRFFVIEIVLYALSTIFQGVVNAERDYLWTSLAPIFNNFVVMGSYIAYAFLRDTQPTLGLLILAIGNPLGVLVQVLLQLPSMHRHGIRITWRIDLHDPALRDTVKIGVPSIVTMILSFVTNSLQLNALLSFTAIGASLGSYAMLWFNLPYAIFSVPITTVLFTELSDYYAAGDMESFTETVVGGSGKILFMLLPFALFLGVFSTPLITIISASQFDADAAALCAFYLMWRAPSLPFYGVGMYLQKVCSATRKMELYAGVCVICSVIQSVLLLFVAPHVGIWLVPFTTCIFYMAFDAIVLLVLKHDFGHIGLRRIVESFLRGLVFGVIGSAVAVGIMHLYTLCVGQFAGPVLHAIMLCVVGGIPAVLVTYGLAVALKIPEASTITTILNRFLKRG